MESCWTHCNHGQGTILKEIMEIRITIHNYLFAVKLCELLGSTSYIYVYIKDIYQAISQYI